MFERMLCGPPRLYIVGLAESLGGHSALSTMMDRIDLAVSFRKVKPPTSVVDIIGRMRLSASETQDAKVHRWRVGYTLAWRCRRIQLCIWHGGVIKHPGLPRVCRFPPSQHNVHQGAHITYSRTYS